MENKGTVLVTGACGGIGKAVSAELLRLGYSVIGLDLADNGFSDPRYRFFSVDITDPESVAAGYRSVFTVTDTLSGIVNTAGLVFMGSLVEEDAETMQKIMDVNVSGMARINRVFFPLLEKGRGRIVNFSSEYGIFCSVPFHGYYTASKHAVERYTDSLRRELRYLGMHVAAIRPGAVDTPMTHGTVPAFEKVVNKTTHFEKVYRRLLPLMTGATAHPTPPAVIARTVGRAMTARHPRRAYNVRQDLRVRLLSLLPAGATDGILYLFGGGRQ